MNQKNNTSNQKNKTNLHFELFFVRHAYSCANEWQDKSRLPGSHWFYEDPEITTQGIKESIAVGQVFDNPFPSQEPFSLASSVMLRAQQTAYLMFGKQYKNYHMNPHQNYY